MANTVEQFGAELKRKMAGIDYSPIFRAIKEIVDRSIAQNFASGGRWGDDLFGGGTGAWKKSKRVLSKGGQTLYKTHQLAQSMNVIVRQEGSKIIIEAGSNMKYAAIHQFGGTINKAARSNLYVQYRGANGKYQKGSTYGKGTTTGAHSITIVARPFVVLQNQDIEEIKMLIAKHMIKVTGSW